MEEKKQSEQKKKHRASERERRHTQNRFNRDTVFIMKENVFILRYTEPSRAQQNTFHTVRIIIVVVYRLRFALGVCVQWLHKRDIYTHYPFIRSVVRCANSIFNAVYLRRMLFSLVSFPFSKLWLFKIFIISMIARIPHAPIN